MGQIADRTERGLHVLVLQDLQDGWCPPGVGAVVEGEGDHHPGLGVGGYRRFWRARPGHDLTAVLADLCVLGAAAGDPDAVLDGRQPGPRPLYSPGNDLLGGVGAVLDDDVVARLHPARGTGGRSVEEHLRRRGMGIDDVVGHDGEQDAVARPHPTGRERAADRRLAAADPHRPSVDAHLRRRRATARHEPEGGEEHHDHTDRRQPQAPASSGARVGRPEGALHRGEGGIGSGQLRSHLP